MTKTSDSIKRFVTQYIAPLLLLFAGVAIVASFGKRKVVSDDSLSIDDTPVVHVQTVGPYDSAVIIEADGLVVPFREIQLATQVSGIVLEKSSNCRAGNEVQKCSNRTIDSHLTHLMHPYAWNRRINPQSAWH